MRRATKMMNCDEYRQALGADPGFEDETGHAETCADCRAYRDDMRALDERIAAAMAIDVPELEMPALPDIDTGNLVTLARWRRFSKPIGLAVAASVMLAVMVGIRMTDTHGGTLAEQVLAHVDHEPMALVVSDTPVSDRRLSWAVPENVATMNHDAGLITYAQSCRINGNKVPHLVIQGERGPITILLMPDEKIDETVSLDGENIQGVILPVGDGSIAIIGEREERLDRVTESVLNSVAWST